MTAALAALYCTEEGERALARLARDVADPPAASLGHHPVGTGLGHQPGAHHVDVEDPAELGRGDGDEGTEPETRPAAAGHVRHEGDGPELGADRAHRGFDGGLVRDVGDGRGGTHPQRCDLGGQRGQVAAAGGAVERGLVVGAGDVETGHVRAAPGQPQRGGPADAAGPRRPGDQRHLAFEGAGRRAVCETHPDKRRTIVGGVPSRGVLMRAAVTRGGRLVVADVADPTPDAGHVVARPLATGICGSDLHALADFAHFSGLMDSVGVPALDPSADCVFGHEFVAEVVEHGPGTAGTLPVGTRVCSVPIIVGPAGVEQIGYSNAYPGALAEHMVLQELLCLPVPDELATGLAALTEPLAVGEHAVGLAGLRTGQPCLVVGCGPVGLAVIAALKGRGHGPVLAADFSPTRRRLAEAFGADVVIDPAEGSPHDRWADFGIARTVMERIGAAMLGGTVTDPVIFEAVGVPGMLQSLIAEAPPHSRIVVVGVCMHTDAIEPFMAVTKEMELRFSFGYTPDEFAATLARLAAGVPGADLLVTASVGLEGAPGAFEMLRTPGEHGKILVTP